MLKPTKVGFKDYSMLVAMVLYVYLFFGSLPFLHFNDTSQQEPRSLYIDNTYDIVICVITKIGCTV